MDHRPPHRAPPWSAPHVRRVDGIVRRGADTHLGLDQRDRELRRAYVTVAGIKGHLAFHSVGVGTLEEIWRNRLSC
jgi:hypothetical protein